MSIENVLTALLPIFLLIALGWGMQRLHFPGGDFWPLAERFMYYFLFPALLVKESASAMAVLTVALRPLLRVGGPAFSSIFQGSMRFNSYVGLAAALALYGNPGVGLFAVAIAVCVPILNVLSVAAMVRYAGEPGRRIDPLAQLRLIATNPLILACVIGIALNLAGIRLPGAINTTAEVLGKSSIALGLMAVGTALDFKTMHAARWPLLAMCTLKLVAFPLAMAGIAGLLGLTGLGRAVVVLWAAVPTSAASYVLARQLGGDARLMAAGITAETVLAAISLPLMLTLLN
jgi:predicted permease